MPLAAPDATLADYAHHLRLLLAWHAPIETWLAQFTDGAQHELPQIHRAPLIARDLADPSIATTTPPTSTWKANDTTPAYRWGVCYVIEGAQLGGAVLYRRLSPRLTGHPLRYLQGEGDGPGPRWQAFIRALRTEVVTQQAIDAACRGACDAFDSLLALREADSEAAA